MLKIKRNLARLVLSLVLLAAMTVGKVEAAEFEMVSYTAYTSLHWLKEAGVPEANEFAEAIGPRPLLNKDEVPNYKVLAPVNFFYHEMRYAAINRYIDKNNYRNVIDIACGFSPRGIILAREGKHFIGAELPSVATAATFTIRKCLTENQQKLATYEAVDATQRDSMMAAADKMNGKICIVMDGLMMYLTRDEQAKTLQNIRDILRKHGGCFVTSDFSSRDFVMRAASVVYREKDADKIYRDSAKVYEDIAEANFDKAFFPDADSAVKFIEAQGLKVERVPLFEEPVKLYSEKKLNKEQKVRLDNLKKEKFLWVITAK